MEHENLREFAAVLIEAINAETIVPAALIKGLGAAAANDAEFISQLKTLWEEKNQERVRNGEPRLELNIPLALVRSGSEKAQQPVKAPEVKGADAESLTKELLDVAERDFELNQANLTKLNSGKPLQRDVLEKVVIERIRSGKLNARVLGIVFGLGGSKFCVKLKKFLEMTSDQHGDKPSELYQNFALYALLSGSTPALFDRLQLSSPLLSFLTDKMGRVREIYFVAIVFGLSFFLVLVTQIVEIANRYQSASEDQKPKLAKLYNSEERIAMLIGNSGALAVKRIAQYKSSSREIQNTFKRYAAGNKDLVTGADLFKPDYGV